MTNEELLSVAEIVERLVARFHKQAADHEAKMFEHRAAFGARTKADAETIDRLHTERDALRAEVADLKTQLERLTSWAAKNQAARETLQTEMERLRSENQIMRNDAEDGYAEAIKVLGDPIALSKERDALRAEVAALKSQTSKPCDQPVTVKREPEVGDTVRLVRVPTMEEYADWEDLFGGVGSLGIVKSLAHQVANVKYNDFTWEWPLSCVEVVTEATHDTDAGKAAAEAAVKTEPVADEIKVGDLVEVFQKTTSDTLADDVSIRGTVSDVFWSGTGTKCVRLIPKTMNRRSRGDAYFSYCDVRKVTT